MVNPALSS